LCLIGSYDFSDNISQENAKNRHFGDTVSPPCIGTKNANITNLSWLICSLFIDISIPNVSFRFFFDVTCFSIELTLSGFYEDYIESIWFAERLAYTLLKRNIDSLNSNSLFFYSPTFYLVLTSAPLICIYEFFFNQKKIYTHTYIHFICFSWRYFSNAMCFYLCVFKKKLN
jgi:hypothetical protein